MMRSQLTNSSSLFKELQPRSTICSKERNVVTINHGIGRPGQNIISSHSCQENTSILERRRMSSSRKMEKYLIGCRLYWHNMLLECLSSFRLIPYRMESRGYVEHGQVVL